MSAPEDPRTDPNYLAWLAEHADAPPAPEPDPEPEPAAADDAGQEPEPELATSQDQDQGDGKPMYYGFQHPDDAAAGVAAPGHVVHGHPGLGAGVSN